VFVAGNLVKAYATALRDQLAAAGVDAGRLTSLVTAADGVQAILDQPDGAVDEAAWSSARTAWENARAAIAKDLPAALLGPLAAVPGLAGLAANLSDVERSGVHGALQLGPVGLDVASATLVVQPPKLKGATPGSLVDAPPVPIGPFPVGQIAAALTAPFGGDGALPGGGALVRLPADGGYGGTLQLPLGPVQVSAAAVLAVDDGQPSFLAVVGAAFTPPIQLSFGFSLDRVGGIVGVNRRADSDALADAVRTGAGGDALFAVRPPASPLALASTIDRLFPANPGTHLVGPSMGLSWLSAGEKGHLLGLDVAVVVQLPTGKVVIVGVARAAIPGLPQVLSLRLDLLGVIDPPEQRVSIDASLVDSHVLGVFEIHGDAAMRFCWGPTGYAVVTVGGFYPGFNPEPARLPALRRAGLSMDNRVPVIDIRAEGYFAITSNTLQFGGHLEIGFDKGLQAHGFVAVDALVQFRPFRFTARISAGFRVSVAGRCFASVGLDGMIGGPGPLVIDGSLSIRVFLFKISWHETFTLGSGPGDSLPSPPNLLDVVRDELNNPANVYCGRVSDPDVVLVPRPGRPTVAAVPATGSLKAAQRRVPLGLLVDRVDGRPLDAPRGVVVTTPGGDVTDRFSPGSYLTLTDSEALHRPPFDVLPCGRELSSADPPPAGFPSQTDDRKVTQIVLRYRVRTTSEVDRLNLAHISALTEAAGKPPALSSTTPLVTALCEQWTAAGATFGSATAAHQHARHHGGIALAAADAAAPVALAGVI